MQMKQKYVWGLAHEQMFEHSFDNLTFVFVLNIVKHSYCHNSHTIDTSTVQNQHNFRSKSQQLKKQIIKN